MVAWLPRGTLGHYSFQVFAGSTHSNIADHDNAGSILGLGRPR
jgi:hypothetical protein